MSDLMLRIGEIRIEGGGGNPDLLRRALEMALGDLARRLQARIAAGDLPESLQLSDLAIRNPDVVRALATSDVRRLAQAIAADLSARLGGAP